MPAQLGVDLREAEAIVENDVIPYIEPGATNTHAHLEFRSTTSGGRMFGALAWGSTQGRLSSTIIRWYITDEDGDAVVFDRSWFVRDVGGSDTAIKLNSWFAGSAPFGESYEFHANDALLWSFGTINGAENFNRMLAFNATQSRGSQVPGGSANTQMFSSAFYESQYGRDQYKPSNHVTEMGLPTEFYGRTGWAQGSTWTWDSACVNP